MSDRNIIRNKIFQRFHFKWNNRRMYIYLCAFHDYMNKPYGDIKGLMGEMKNNDKLVDEFMAYSSMV